MKRVTLVRHAKSNWTEGVTDFERPLNERGRRDAPRMGASLLAKGILPERFVSSPAKRAATTAQLLCEALNLDPKGVVAERRLYDASSSQIMEVISHLPDAFTHVALVAHNPGMSDTLRRLVIQDTQDFPTCGVAYVELDIDAWEEVHEGCGRLVHFLYPKGL